MKTLPTILAGLLISTLFGLSSLSAIQAGPANGPCPKYQGADGRCTGSQPRHCTYKQKPGYCHNLTNHETGEVSCRCFPKKSRNERNDAANEPLEFDPQTAGDVAIDPDSGEPVAGSIDRPTCIGMKFPHAWYPKGSSEAGFWGGCTLIAWRYPPGDYRKPGGGILKWGGGHSPFRRVIAD